MILERLGELEDDGLLSVKGRSPDEVLAGLFEAALEQNLTNAKNVQRMKLNVAEDRNTVEKYVDTWSTVLSKALDRVQKRRKEKRQARKDEKDQLKVRQQPCSQTAALRSCPSSRACFRLTDRSPLLLLLLLCCCCCWGASHCPARAVSQPAAMQRP